MRERAVERLPVVACIVAGLMLAGSTAGQNPQAAKLSEKKNPPTVANAQKFLEEVESRYFDLTNKAQRASWVEENFITDDTEQIAAEANQELNTFSAEMSKKAHEFDKVALQPEMERKMLLLKLASGFPAPADQKEQKELAQVLASLDGDYGKGKWCPGGDSEVYERHPSRTARVARKHHIPNAPGCDRHAEGMPA